MPDSDERSIFKKNMQDIINKIDLENPESVDALTNLQKMLQQYIDQQKK
jgi:hypothetical protein